MRFFVMLVYGSPFPIIGSVSVAALGQPLSRIVGYAGIEVLLAYTIYLLFLKYEYILNPKLTDEEIARFLSEQEKKGQHG